MNGAPPAVSVVGDVSGPATERGGLTVIETASLHDGEPMHWWQWGGGAPQSATAPGPAAKSSHHKAEEFPFSAGGTDQPGEAASVDRAGSADAINRNIGGGAS